ncbi:hypothetical protein D3C76_1500930 [compost metagenome]
MGFVVANIFDDFHGPFLFNGDVKLRVLTLHIRSRLDKIGHNTWKSSHMKLSAKRGGLGVQGFQFINPLQNVQCLGNELFAFGSGVSSLPRAFEQDDTQFFLQTMHRLADRRLCDMQML